MLSPADQAICDRDPALAGLPPMLDADALAAALGCGAVTPAHLRDKPGVSCRVAFLRDDGQPLAVYAYCRDRYGDERAIDLGNFLAHLDEYALRQTGEAAALAMPARAFLHGYGGVRPLPDPARVQVFRDLSPARHIRISTRFRDRRHTTGALIALSLTACAQPHRQDT